MARDIPPSKQQAVTEKVTTEFPSNRPSCLIIPKIPAVKNNSTTRAMDIS